MKKDKSSLFFGSILLGVGILGFVLPLWSNVVVSPKGNFFFLCAFALGLFYLGQHSGISVKKPQYLLSDFNDGTEFKIVHCIRENVSGAIVVFIVDDVDSYNILIEKFMYDNIKEKESKEFVLVKGDLIPINETVRQ